MIVIYCKVFIYREEDVSESFEKYLKENAILWISGKINIFALPEDISQSSILKENKFYFDFFGFKKRL